MSTLNFLNQYSQGVSTKTENQPQKTTHFIITINTQKAYSTLLANRNLAEKVSRATDKAIALLPRILTFPEIQLRKGPNGFFRAPPTAQVISIETQHEFGPKDRKLHVHCVVGLNDDIYLFRKLLTATIQDLFLPIDEKKVFVNVRRIQNGLANATRYIRK
jgi:hypothetical protein